MAGGPGRPAARAVLSRILAVLGAVVLVAGVLATYLREEVVDQRAFVAHAVDALDEPAVRDLVSGQVVQQLVDEGGTDLIAARPLVRPLVDALVSTEAFGELFEVAARDTHRLLFTRDDDVSFAVADAGTLAIEAVRAAAPGLAESLPATVDVDVVALRDEDLLAGLARAGERARTLALVLPPLGLLLVLAGVAVARDRRAALVRGGLSVAVACGLLVAALTVWRARLGAGAVAPSDLRDEDVRAAVDAAWGVYFAGLRDWLVAIGLAGVMTAALAAGRVTAATATQRLRALVARAGGTPAGAPARTLRGVALVALGGLLLWQPAGVVAAVALLLGGTLVYVGVGELAALLPDRLTRDEPARTGGAGGRGTGPLPWLAAVGVLLLGAVVAGAAVGGDGPAPERASLSPPTPEQATSTGCNGSRALCDRRLDEVVFPGTHNSFSAALEPGWLFANQRTGIRRQLQDGIRLLLLDPHHGVRDGSRVRTDLEADGSDRNRVAAQLSPGAVRAAERLGGRVGLGDLKGRRDVFLCHSLCELGAESFVAELGVVRDFLAANRGEVVVLLIEPSVSPQLVAGALRRARLLDALAVLDRDEPLPTLGQLLRRGDRLVVLTERDGGAYDWYHPAFSFVQDTPLGARKASEFSCAPNRGDEDSPLLMLNHWIDRFPPPFSANRRASTAAALRERVARCEQERGRPVNLIAVDFGDASGVVEVARELNARADDPGDVG
ncbi:hypothetical protein [Paraconexibacter algicola]|uniref:Phosphatidylinositol diacylglycerol-lyase n=1 Tax=Paraconexibacter algicola TaxID=2133960 RepID=A0A2T4ULZ8_9ACTN|nr:hypothetical protein [Paraconexibacter algicola]PTL60221.1 hypothetical protein C7Y72_11520 [Paraconexibacter algicola]